MLEWNVDAIFESLGGPDAIHELIHTKTDRKLTIRAVRKWRERGRIPPEWLLYMLVWSGATIPDGFIWNPEPELEDIF